MGFNALSPASFEYPIGRAVGKQILFLPGTRQSGDFGVDGTLRSITLPSFSRDLYAKRARLYPTIAAILNIEIRIDKYRDGCIARNSTGDCIEKTYENTYAKE